MLYAKVDKKEAERTKSLLIRIGALADGAPVLHSDSYVLFPVYISSAKVKKLIESAAAGVVERKTTAMGGKPEAAAPAVGYELLGSIAIIEVPKGERRRERKIAESVMAANRNIKTVLAKAGPVSGVYRTRKFRHIAGQRNCTAVLRENGCVFTFDVRKAFFSGRLSFERSRIASLVSGKEKVIVMFAGVGPFAIEIAKRHPKSTVVAIELNRYAFACMRKNVAANRATNVTPVLGNVDSLASKYRGFADRIVMPLPMSSRLHLGSALMMAKRRAVLHVYAFGSIGSAAGELSRFVEARAKVGGRRARLVFSRKVRNYSAKEIEVVADFSVEAR